MSSNINSKRKIEPVCFNRLDPNHNLENPTKKTVPCRFFASGFCVKGDICPFSHDQSEPATSSPTNKSYYAPVIHSEIPVTIKEISPPSSFYSPDAEGPIVLRNFADLKLTENRPSTENIPSKKYSETLSANIKGANSKLLPSIRNGLSVTTEAPKSKEVDVRYFDISLTFFLALYLRPYWQMSLRHSLPQYPRNAMSTLPEILSSSR